MAAVYEAHVESLARQTRTTETSNLANAIAEELSVLASSVDDMDEYYLGMERILSMALPFERLSLAIVAPTGRSYTHVYTSGEPVGGWRVGDTVQRSDSSTWRGLDLRVPVVMQDEAAAGRYKSLLAIPVVSGNKVVAGLNLRHSDPNAYDDQHLGLARTVAESLAAPLSYLPLYVGLVKKAAHADVIAEIGRLVSSVTEIGEVYSQFAGIVGELIDFDRLSISAIGPNSGALEVLYVDGVAFPGREHGAVRDTRGTLVGSALEQGRVVALDGDSLRASWPGADDLLRAGLQSIMAAPLMIEGVPVGAMLMAKKSPEGYIPEHLALAGRIASQISGLVAAELRRKDQDRDVAEKEALGDLARKAGSSLDISEVYDSVSSNLATLIPHDSFVIGSVNLEARTVVCNYSSDESEFQGREIEIDDPYFWLSLDLGYPWAYRATDVLKDMNSRDQIPGMAEGGLYPTLVIPLRQNGKSVAVLVAQSLQKNAYDERIIALAGRVGSHLQGAIANAAVHRRSVELAREHEVRLKLEAENLELIGAAQARSEFLSNVSHELRTPLTTVSSLTSSLAKTVNVTGSEREQTILKRVRGATGRLKEVVDALLNVSELDAGKSNLDWAPINLRSVLVKLVDRFENSESERSVRIDAKITDIPLPICGDAAKLEQAISNVLDNAVRYSDSGSGVRFDVGIDGDAVCISIVNSGSSLSDDQIIQVTKPFYRADNLATRSESGVGVGLAISKAIVELHEGSLLVGAIPEGGMRADILIPLSHG
ncbi:MAG: GAF domain-containing protein [Chloroflexi bacterium]|nr:GAF domain-containing protein [Chloroflexota bacterium]MBT4074133.1 GAF domain-containing protein [Chloroflexota bacterium]MBT6682756.1 GAF domain-containing protein [Chloroflexota bacterium]